MIVFLDFDNTITLGVYNKLTHVEAFQFDMTLHSQQVLALGDSCFTPALCITQGIYDTVITFPNNTNGYYVSWQRCCRNGIIQNITVPGSAGMVFYAEIPDPALANSTPVFGSYPKAYMCVSQPNIDNFSATDIDGDVLVYSLITPLNGNGTSATPIPGASSGPYSSINWQSPYSAADMVGGSPVMSINSQTGILSASPGALGVFVFAVRVEEYRNGMKIGEIRRDVQYQVLSCSTNSAPYFSLPQAHTYNMIGGDTACLTIKASDPNFDWLVMNASSPELFQHSPDVPAVQFSSDSAFASVQSLFCIQTKCSDIRPAPYRVTFYARDRSCYGTNLIPFDLDIYVNPPEDGNIAVANIFTPNNDGVNDHFKINAPEISRCFDYFNVKIYGRWGELVFESDDLYFKWDGRNHHGKELSDGVYYCIMDSSYGNVKFNYNSFIHLLR